MINSMMLHSFQDNAGIRQLTEVLKICQHMYFCCSWFSNMVSFRYVVLFLNILHDIFSIKFYTVLILCEHNFLLMRNIRNECWILKKVFREMTLKLYLMKSSERKPPASWVAYITRDFLTMLFLFVLQFNAKLWKTLGTIHNDLGLVAKGNIPSM